MRVPRYIPAWSPLSCRKTPRRGAAGVSPRGEVLPRASKPIAFLHILQEIQSQDTSWNRVLPPRHSARGASLRRRGGRARRARDHGAELGRAPPCQRCAGASRADGTVPRGMPAAAGTAAPQRMHPLAARGRRPLSRVGLGNLVAPNVGGIERDHAAR